MKELVVAASENPSVLFLLAYGQKKAVTGRVHIDNVVGFKHRAKISGPTCLVEVVSDCDT